MRDRLGPATTLSYCTNVHPGGTLALMQKELSRHAEDVKRLASPDAPMGIGMWIPYYPSKRSGLAAIVAGLVKAALRIQDPEFTRFRAYLKGHGLEAVTCNAFPCHDFHGEVVKHRVYEPDWSDSMRIIQTFAAAGLMEKFNPHAESISISTLPIGWRARGDNGHVIRLAAENIRKMARFLDWHLQPERPVVTLDLEPEPGCILDTADDVIAFFDEHLPDEIHRRHIGVCHDVCHAAVMFEDQREVLRRYAEAGIRVNKVQISSALDVDVRAIGVKAAIEYLRPFAEPRYLHQTGFMTGGDRERGFELIEDLPDAIGRLGRAREAGDNSQIPDRLRVHFHVPVYLDSIGPLGTTNDQIADAVAAAREYHDTKHFEVETYAWGVLPEELKRETLAEGIADELRWVLKTCGDASS